MEDLEQKSRTIFPKPPSLWIRYGDDIYAYMETEQSESFHLYLNRQTARFSLQQR